MFFVIPYFLNSPVTGSNALYRVVGHVHAYEFPCTPQPRLWTSHAPAPTKNVWASATVRSYIRPGPRSQLTLPTTPASPPDETTCSPGSSWVASTQPRSVV